MRTLLATVVRGLRARALLSAGSVLLTALAIGSAVLGPIFQVAVTNSYLVTRLDEAPNELTGLSWRFQPGSQLDHDVDQAVRRAGEAAAAAARGPFADPQTVLESQRVEALGGAQVMLTGKDGACDHLEIEGDCPTKPGQVLMLAGDLDLTELPLGEKVDLGPDLGTVTIVGGYRVPADEADFWFQPDRFASFPPQVTRFGSLPYRPAPLVTTPATFDAIPAGQWSVRVDRRLQVPADLQLADVEAAEKEAAALDGPAAQVEGGTLRGESINDVSSIVAEARGQQRTAKSSVAPAVISLVLVALALLLRLLMAAADLRLPELALASLRGLPRRRMWALGLSEPMTLLLLSIPVGGLVGVGLALGLVRWWLVPGLPLPFPATAVLAGLLVAVASIGVAVLAVGLVLRVSLSDQLTGVRRPQETSRTGLVVQLALVAPRWPSWPASSPPASRATRTPPTWCCRCCSPSSPASRRPGSPPRGRRGGRGPVVRRARCPASSPPGRSAAARRAPW